MQLPQGIQFLLRLPEIFLFRFYVSSHGNFTQPDQQPINERNVQLVLLAVKSCLLLVSSKHLAAHMLTRARPSTKTDWSFMEEDQKAGGHPLLSYETPSMSPLLALSYGKVGLTLDKLSLLQSQTHRDNSIITN